MNTLASGVMVIVLVGSSLVLSTLAGVWVGRRLRQDGTHAQLGMLQGAMLGLMSLLLGFAFAGATSRFGDRQLITAQEGSDLTTLYMRAELLPTEHAERVRAQLRAYAKARLDLFYAPTLAVEVLTEKELAALHRALWRSAAEATADNPHNRSLLIPLIDNVADRLDMRNSSERQHIPTAILVMLWACSCAAMCSVGYGVAHADKRTHLPAAVLVLLTAAVLCVTIDMDYPRLGLIQLDPVPLIEALDSMRPPGTAAP